MNKAHVTLVTKETLCGFREVPEDDTGLFFDGVNAGPSDSITCETCRELFAHILQCPTCLERTQAQTERTVFSILVRLGEADKAKGARRSSEELAAALERELSKHFFDAPHYANNHPKGTLTVDEFRQFRANFEKSQKNVEDDTPPAKLPPSGARLSNNDPNTEEEKEMSDMSRKPASPLSRKSQEEEAVIRDVTVQREGEKIIVPDGMDYNIAIAALQRRAEEEEQEVTVSYDFDMTPPEGAIALLRTLRELHNFVSVLNNPGFFGPSPPLFLNVEVDIGKTEQIPWGRMAIPGMSGYVMTEINWVDETPFFRLSGRIKGKHKYMVQQIVDAMKTRTDSLYRGKAIVATFPELDPEGGQTIEDFFPKFMKLPNIGPEDLIFSDDTADIVDTLLFTPIEQSKACRANNISLKRGILLEGPYGVGKTLTATVSARKCVENGWTFIYLKNVAELPRALHFAQNYQPAVIFAEDIDQVLSDPDERDEEVNAILNSMDGIDTKGTEIITVLTTNNVSNITSAMLRPGRIDTVVEVRAPDAKAAARLVSRFVGDRAASGEDFTEVGERLAGCIPAMIQETVERSKLASVRREARGGVPGITARDVEVAALSLVSHMKLLEPKEADTRSNREKAAESFGAAMGEALSKVVDAAANPGKVMPNGKSTHTPATA